MNKWLYVLVIVLCLTSCGQQYSIDGTSSVPCLDGRMLFLKVVKGNDMVAVDSSEVVHGQFHFNGITDSIQMASIYMDSESIMPLVLEVGNLNVSISDTQQKVSGSDLNDKLYTFIDKKSRLENEMDELGHKENQMIMNGVNADLIQIKMEDETQRLVHEDDKLVTSFIIDNFNNVLGAGMFMILTGNYKYPIMTPQIEDIMSKATPYFRNNPYVREYITTAKDNMKKMHCSCDY